MFAKIYRQIFDSSIAENPDARFTFMDLLILADKHGVVDITHESLARITNRPLEVIKRTISDLEKPDALSRTKVANGCRLKRLKAHREWGWQIVNYERYRRITSEEERREYMKNYMRDRRNHNKPKDDNDLRVSKNANEELTGVNSSASPSASVPSSRKGSAEGKPSRCDLIHDEKRLKRIEDRIKTIQGQATESAFGKTYSEGQKTEIKELRSIKKQLLEALDYPV